MSEPVASRAEGRGRGLARWVAAGPRSTGDGAAAAYLVIFCFFLAITSVNILTELHDAARHGPPLALWQPMVWEYTSGVAVIAFAGLARLALKIAPVEGGRWLRFAAVHLATATAFSGLHIAAMVGLRTAIYALLGRHYAWAVSDTLYEYRKDLLSYVTIAAAFWVCARLRRRPAAADERSPATFDIVDGARTLRTPVDEIVAVQSAGNYVEFRLADGATRLMRATLADVERSLTAHGFVRVHRSWIVNAHRLRLLEPSGSGDYRLVLDGGVEAPVSRRYPAALARLKGAAP